jgi:hypothetical protein
MHPTTGTKEIEKLPMVLIKNYARQRFGGALRVSEFVKDAFKCTLAFHDKRYRTASLKIRYAEIVDL